MAFEISLERLGLAESGRLEPGKAGSNLLSATLVCPSPGRPTVTTVKAFKLKDDQTIDLTGEDPQTGQPFTYGDRVVFKEEFVGHSELILEVTDVEQPTVLDKVLTALIGAVFKGAWSVVTGGVSNVIMGAVLEVASGAHLDSLKLDGAKVRLLGRARLDLSSAMSEGPLNVPLVVPADVELTQVVLKPGGASGFDLKKVVIRKGTVNGRIRLQVTRA